MSAGGVRPAVSGVPSSVNIPPGLLMVVLVFGWVLVLLLCFLLLGVLTYDDEPTDGLECSATESSLCEWMEMEDAFSFFVRLRKERPIILSLHAHED